MHDYGYVARIIGVTAGGIGSGDPASWRKGYLNLQTGLDAGCVMRKTERRNDDDRAL